MFKVLNTVSDKFDQFWAVNRKLMEVGSGGEDTFKYIPFRCYLVDHDYSMIQRLVKPLTDDGHRKTLQCLIEEVFPSKADNGNNIYDHKYLMK